MHRGERDHGMIDVVRRPSHPRHIFPPEMLTRASTDGVDCLRDEMVVEWQCHVPRVEESIVSHVKGTRRVNGLSPFEHFLWDIDT